MRTWAAIGLLPMAGVAWCILHLIFRIDIGWPILAAGAALVWPGYAYSAGVQRLFKSGGESQVMCASFSAAAISAVLTWLLLPRLGIVGGLLAAAAGQWSVLCWIALAERRESIGWKEVRSSGPSP
jgi:hypothetical protein